MAENFAELYDIYASNILSRTMVDALADELGVTSESLLRLGLGYFPGGGDRAFIMPERDNFGNIIGLVRRFRSGKKYMIKGSKRGLYYELNPEFTGKEQRYAAGKHNWIRIAAAGVECPICGREDWCLVSSDDPYDPRAVVCSRVSEGSTKQIRGSGFLHIRKPEGELCNGSQGPLLETESPIIVVEGYSDAASALDLGFVAVGRPSAESGTEILPSLVRGREVIIIGDNDDGAGERGMEATFIALSSVCKRVTKVMPPKHFKDLRQWKNGSDLTKEKLIEWAEGEGEDTGDPDLLSDDVACTIADRWVHLNRFYDGLPTIRNYRGQWLNWEGGQYANYDEGELRGELYEFVDGKLFPQIKPDGEIKLTLYRPSRSKVSDVVDALGRWCYIRNDPPTWLRDNGLPDPVNLIAFKNGILDVEEYVRGNVKLYTPTPALFSFNVLPYDFDEDAHSELWSSFCNDVFSGDSDKIKLLSQWFGYNCVPDMQYEKLMFCTGRPRSGKGTVANTLTALLGEGQCASTSFQSLSSGFGYQNLIGKLAVMMYDERVAHRAQAISALEKILKVVGGDSVGAQRKFLTDLNLHLSCRFTIVANDLPDIPDSANALKPRLNVLHFENSYAGREDTTLKQRLKQEASDGKLINFALQGLKSLKETGKFVVPQSSHAIINQMEEIAAPVTAFVRDCCNLRPPGDDEDYHVILNELYEAWACWCKDTGTFQNGMQHLGRDLLQACPSIKKRRLSMSGKRYHVYDGVRLTEEAKNKYLGRY